MIKSAISNTVYIRLVTTTSIVAKLAVCAVLIGGAVSCAQAATRKPAVGSPSQAKLAELERDWKRLHSRSHRGAIDRLVICHEYGQCGGLRVHPALAAEPARIRAAAADDEGVASPPSGGAAAVSP